MTFANRLKERPSKMAIDRAARTTMEMAKGAQVARCRGTLEAWEGEGKVRIMTRYDSKTGRYFIKVIVLNHADSGAGSWTGLAVEEPEGTFPSDELMAQLFIAMEYGGHGR